MGMVFGSLLKKQKVAQGVWPLQGFLSKPLQTDIFENKHIADAMCDLVAAVGGRPDCQGLEIFRGNPKTCVRICCLALTRPVALGL